jgi:hypothetical protein
MRPEEEFSPDDGRVLAGRPTRAKAEFSPDEGKGEILAGRWTNGGS